MTTAKFPTQVANKILRTLADKEGKQVYIATPCPLSTGGIMVNYEYDHGSGRRFYVAIFHSSDVKVKEWMSGNPVEVPELVKIFEAEVKA